VRSGVILDLAFAQPSLGRSGMLLQYRRAFVLLLRISRLCMEDLRR
jgi:hypothetical protein